jgi:hypothetical protein
LCQDVVQAVRQQHSVLVDAVPAVFLEARTFQTGADLGINFGCKALGEHAGTCHSMRQSFLKHLREVTSYTRARDYVYHHMAPNPEQFVREERERLAKVLIQSQEEIKLTTKEQDFISAVQTLKAHDELVKEAADVYMACTRLARCPNEPTNEVCRAALGTQACMVSGTCEAAKSHCPDSCRICAWVLRSWPAFAVGSACGATTPEQIKAAVAHKSATAPAPLSPAVDGPVEGPLSHPLEAAMQTGPLTSVELDAEMYMMRECSALSWAVVDLQDAMGVVTSSAGEGGVGMMGPYPWSPALACSCLGRCSYSSMDALKLHDAGCLGPSSAREAEAWDRRLEEDASSSGRLYRIAEELRQQRAFQAEYFDVPREFAEARTRVRKNAEALKGLDL